MRATPLAEHEWIGISTGVLAEFRGDWTHLVDEVSTSAIKLSALSGQELPGLVSYLRGKVSLPFRYVSVHTPVKDIDEQSSRTLLRGLPTWVVSIVVHPDAITDLDLYRTLGARLVLENMDYRKPTGRFADELEIFFGRFPDAGFCLDIAHAYSIDSTMQVAHELLERFLHRLRQVHLSSLSRAYHVALREDDEALFADVLDRCRHVPWILEAPAPARWSARR